MKVKNTTINIICSDITQLDVDAIVNPANCQLKMEKGLSGTLKAKGGNVIEEEALEKGPIKEGEAIFTNAGHLKANYIIHSAAVDNNMNTDEHIIRNACRSALECANSIGVHSIAIPGIGTGVGGFPIIGSAKIMSQEILKVAKFGESTLKEINICLFEEEIYKTFNQTISGYITHIQDTLGDGPYATADIIIELKEGIILIERSNPPYGWALPGGFVDYGESLEETAIREAKEETDMDLEDLRQFHTYSKYGRDPRFQTVTTVFIAKGKGTPKSGDDAKDIKVIQYEDLLNHKYAFDHFEIIKDYLNSQGK